MTTSSNRYRLSKSKIAAFEHCPRRLWLQIHHREVGHFDSDTLARFRIGHEVGRLATVAMPDGVLVEAEPNIEAALVRTTQLIAHDASRPIFEATFQHHGVLVRVDILEPVGLGSWHAIEVKASTRLKKYQLADIATQVWVMRSCGLTISRATIRHLARPLNWKRPDYNAVCFTDADVTRRIESHLASREEIAASARAVIRGAEVLREMGSHCTRPFACEFLRHCGSACQVPTQF